MDAAKLDKRRGIYAQQLFEVIERTGAHLYWVNGGHMLADPMTKLPASCAETLASLAEALQRGCIRIAYDTESYKRALAKRTGDIRQLSLPARSLADDAPNDLTGKSLMDLRQAGV